MHDVYDGTAWREAEVGLRREYVDGEVRDEELEPSSRHKVVSYRYGHHFAINLDW